MEYREWLRKKVLEAVDSHPDMVAAVTMSLHKDVTKMVDELILEGKIKWTTIPAAIRKDGRLDKRYRWSKMLVKTDDR